MTTKRFIWTGATGVAAATGTSGVLSTPNPYKVVHARLLTGTAATIEVYGSIDGGVTKHLLDTLTLTGDLGEDATDTTTAPNAWDSMLLKCTALTGTFTADVRYAHN
jgi:hypothetical protein